MNEYTAPCKCMPACFSLQYNGETSQAPYEWRKFLGSLDELNEVGSVLYYLQHISKFLNETDENDDEENNDEKSKRRRKRDLIDRAKGIIQELEKLDEEKDEFILNKYRKNMTKRSLENSDEEEDDEEEDEEDKIIRHGFNASS